MELIIFFTNKVKLKDVKVYLPFELNNTFDGTWFKEYKFTDDKMVLLVADGIDEKAIQTMLTGYPSISHLYYIYHSLPSTTVKDKISAYSIEKGISLVSEHDIHQKGKSKFYHLVKKLIENPLTEALFDELKSNFGYDEVLEKILILLHDCLHYESAATTDTSWLSIEQKKIVEYLAKQKDNFNDDYILALTKLRKTLLGS